MKIISQTKITPKFTTLNVKLQFIRHLQIETNDVLRIKSHNVIYPDTQHKHSILSNFYLNACELQFAKLKDNF